MPTGAPAMSAPGSRARQRARAGHLRVVGMGVDGEHAPDIGEPPAVDRLVVVADAADVAARLGEQGQPVVLRGVGVLIFVDEDVLEALLVGPLPGVLKMGGIERFVVGGIEIVHA